MPDLKIVRFFTGFRGIAEVFRPKSDLNVKFRRIVQKLMQYSGSPEHGVEVTRFLAF
jgi:hypothetical protein